MTATDRCNCATFGNAALCSHHTQSDYDLADQKRYTPLEIGDLIVSVTDRKTGVVIFRGVMVDNEDSLMIVAEAGKPSRLRCNVPSMLASMTTQDVG